MKTIAEQVYPDSKSPKFQSGVLVKREAYTLASEHWAAFMEWTIKEHYHFYDEEKKSWWMGNLLGPMTTTELFQYWFNNVKDKG
jgi:hypothetical protein